MLKAPASNPAVPSSDVILLDGVEVGVEWCNDRLRLHVHGRGIVLPWTPSLLARASAWLRSGGVRELPIIIEERLRLAIEAQTVARDPACAPILRCAAGEQLCLLLCTSILKSRPSFAQALRTSPAAVFVARLLNRECRSVPAAQRRLRRWQDAFREHAGTGVDARTVERWSTAPMALWHLRAVRMTVVPREFVALSLAARIAETVRTMLGEESASRSRRERPAVRFFAIPRVRRAIHALLCLDHVDVTALWRPFLATPIPREAILLEHLVARAFLVGLGRTESDVAVVIVAAGLNTVLAEAQGQRIGAVANLSKDGAVAAALRTWFAGLAVPPPPQPPGSRGPPAPRPPPMRKTQAILSLWRQRQPSPSAQAVREIQRNRPALKVMGRRRFWALGLDRYLHQRAFRLALSWCSSRTDSTGGAVDGLVEWERVWSADHSVTPALQATLAGLDKHLTAEHFRCLRRVKLARAIPSLAHLRVVTMIADIDDAEVRDPSIARVCGLPGPELTRLTRAVDAVAQQRHADDGGAGVFRWVLQRVQPASVVSDGEWLGVVRSTLRELGESEPILAVQRFLGRSGFVVDDMLRLPPLPAPPPPGVRVVRDVGELWNVTRGDRLRARQLAIPIIDGQAWLLMKDPPPGVDQQAASDARPRLVLVARGGHILWSSLPKDADLKAVAGAWAAAHGRFEYAPDPPDWIGLHPGLPVDFDHPRLGRILLQHRARELELTDRMWASAPQLQRSGTMSSNAAALARSLSTMTKREDLAVIVVVVEGGQWSMESIPRGQSGLLLSGSAALATPRVHSRHAAPVDLVVRNSVKRGEVEALWLGGPWPGPLETVIPTRLAPDVLYGAELPGRHVFVYVPSRFDSDRGQRVSATWGPLPTSASAPASLRSTPRVTRVGDRLSVASDAFVVIGRDPRRADVLVDAPSVSPQHLLLWPRALGWQAVDLATPWGTRIVRGLAIDTGPREVSVGSLHWDLPGLASSRAVSVGSRLCFGGGAALEIDINEPR